MVEGDVSCGPPGYHEQAALLFCQTDNKAADAPRKPMDMEDSERERPKRRKSRRRSSRSLSPEGSHRDHKGSPEPKSDGAASQPRPRGVWEMFSRSTEASVNG